MEPLPKYTKAFRTKQAKVGGAASVIGHGGLSKAGLVAVEREVSRGGKTHRQIYWCHPGDKQPGDKEVGGGRERSEPVELHDHTGPGEATRTSAYAVKYLDIEAEPWKAKLTQVEKDTVISYTGSGYKGMNNLLRKGGDYEGVSEKLLTEKVHDMDKAVYKGTLSTDTVVWRGVGTDISATLKAGMKFKDNGFVSTSLMAQVSADFAGGERPEERTMIRIKVPKGSHAAIPDGMSNIKEEAEVVLPRSTEFKIVSESREKLGNKEFRVLEAEVVKQPKNPPAIKVPKAPKEPNAPKPKTPKEPAATMPSFKVGSKIKIKPDPSLAEWAPGIDNKHPVTVLSVDVPNMKGFVMIRDSNGKKAILSKSFFEQ